MNVKHILSFATLLCVMVACSADHDVMDTYASGAKLMAKVGGDVESRAAFHLDVSMLDGSVAYLWVDHGFSQQPLFEGRAYSYQASTKQLLGDSIYFPFDGAPINLYSIVDIEHTLSESVFPRTFNKQPHSVQRSMKSYAECDVLYGRVMQVDHHSKIITIPYRHIMSKVKVVIVNTIESSNAFLGSTLENVQVCNTAKQVTFEFSKDEAMPTVRQVSTTTRDITLTNDVNRRTYADEESYVHNECIVAPQLLRAGTGFIKLTLADGRTYAYNLPQDINLQMGVVYTFVIFPRNGIIYVPAMTMNDWNAEPMTEYVPDWVLSIHDWQVYDVPDESGKFELVTTEVNDWNPIKI